MAYSEALHSISLNAARDLSNYQYRFVQVDSDGQVDYVQSAGGSAIGVLQNKPDAAGRAGTVALIGITKIVASAAIAAGADVSSAADGRAVTAASTYKILGKALEAADAAGDIISMVLLPAAEASA